VFRAARAEIPDMPVGWPKQVGPAVAKLVSQYAFM